jgi:hypothetical protein
MSDPCHHLDVLDRPACLGLLATAGIGRVVFTIRALPAVQPVRFALCDDAVVFRVSARNALFARVVDSVVAVEADSFDDDIAAGWFVTVLGRAKEDREGRPGVDRWIRVPIESVSGRRITHTWPHQ